MIQILFSESSAVYSSTSLTTNEFNLIDEWIEEEKKNRQKNMQLSIARIFRSKLTEILNCHRHKIQNEFNQKMFNMFECVWTEEKFTSIVFGSFVLFNILRMHASMHRASKRADELCKWDSIEWANETDIKTAIALIGNIRIEWSLSRNIKHTYFSFSSFNF